MLKVLTAIVVVLALSFAFATPSFAAERPSRAKRLSRVRDRISDKMAALTMNHAGKITLGSMAIAGASSYAAYAAKGVPLKVVAGAVVLGSLYAAARHAAEFALNNFTMVR